MEIALQKKSIFIFLSILAFAVAVVLLWPNFVGAQTIYDGDLIRAQDTFDVYIVKLTGTKKFKRLILNPAIFESYGHLKWEDVKDLSQPIVDEYTNSTLAIEVNADGSVADPRVFIISSSPNTDVGEKRWIDVSASKFEELGFDWDAIYKINQTEAALNFYPTSATLTTDEELLPWAEPFKQASPKPEPIPEEEPAPQEELIDVCANDIGNGAEIIAGPAGPEGADRDNPFRSLTVNPTDPNYILLGTERNGFLRSLDGGATWERLRSGLRHNNGGYPEIYDIAFAASNPNVIYAATVDSPGPLTRDGAISGVYKSTDGGTTWQRKNCGIQDNGGRVTAVYVDPQDENHAFIAISGGETSYFTATQPAGLYIDGGIYETKDGGDQWTRVITANQDEKMEYVYFRTPANKPNEIYIFGYSLDDIETNIGFVKSMDRGAVWEQFAPFMRTRQSGSFDISSDGTTIYAHSDEYKIYKSVDAGVTWLNYPLSTSGYTITVAPHDNNIVLFGRTDGLFISTDNFYSQKKVIDLATSNDRVSDVVFAPSSPSIVYVVQGGYTIYRSIDGGHTFTNLGNLREDVLNK